MLLDFSEQVVAMHEGGERVRGFNRTRKDLGRPIPPSKKDFLGLVNYYQRFVPKFSSRAGPLTNLLADKGKGTTIK